MDGQVSVETTSMYGSAGKSCRQGQKSPASSTDFKEFHGRFRLFIYRLFIVPLGFYFRKNSVISDSNFRPDHLILKLFNKRIATLWIVGLGEIIHQLSLLSIRVPGELSMSTFNPIDKPWFSPSQSKTFLSFERWSTFGQLRM